METAVKKLYEVMFLVDPANASDWDAVVKTLKKTLERAEAEIVSMDKWDERKLAYKISGKTRGTYILCYFKADGERIRDIEKNAKLSEQIMRVLILSAETREKENFECAPIPPGSPQEDSKMEIQEDIVGSEAEKEKHEEAEESKQETEQVVEPEQPDEPAAADMTKQEQLQTEKDV